MDATPTLIQYTLQQDGLAEISETSPVFLCWLRPYPTPHPDSEEASKGYAFLARYLLDGRPITMPCYDYEIATLDSFRKMVAWCHGVVAVLDHGDGTTWGDALQEAIVRG